MSRRELARIVASIDGGSPEPVDAKKLGLAVFSGQTPSAYFAAKGLAIDNIDITHDQIEIKLTRSRP